MDTLLTAPTVAITTTFQVSFGQNINNSVGQLEYISQAPTVDIAPIAGGAAGGAVLLICVIIVLIIFPVVCYYHSTVSKYKEELKFAQQPVYTLVNIIAYFNNHCFSAHLKQVYSSWSRWNRDE